MQVSRQSPVVSRQEEIAHGLPLTAYEFDAALSLLGPFAAFPHIAVALSGGADSMALTLLADAWAQARGGRITALTVDHGLRPESRAEAEQVAAWMRVRGIAHHILTPEHAHASNNLQEAARRWRYDALADYCRANGILHCLMAHHAGDQRETIVHHTARGATADGASGMARARNYRGVRFLRPLLGMEKEDFKALLQSHAMSWIEDPSNSNTDFARVRIRQQLVQDTALRHTLDEMARTQRNTRAAREQAQAALAACCTTIHPAGFAELAREAWLALEPRLASGLLADLLTTIGGGIHRPRAADTSRLVAALTASSRKRTLHGCEITTHGNCIRIARERARTATALTLAGKGYAEWDQRFRVHYDLPAGFTLTLQAFGTAKPWGRQRPAIALPPATPSLWHLDAAAYVPHIPWQSPHWPSQARVTIGFAPPKPLAAMPFW